MEKTLKILMVSSDRKLFEEGSAVSARMKEYGNLVGELHIVVLALKSSRLEKRRLAKNVWAYPTNSFSRWFYVHDASRLGKRTVFENKFIRGESMITAQDPFECGWAGLKIKKRWRIPLEVQLHTDPFSPYFSGFLNLIRRKIAKKILRQTDGVRAVTQELKSKISSFTSADIRVLPIYIDKKKIEEGRIAFDLHARYGWRFILLSVSRLAPEKNLPLALTVLALVRARFPDTGLVIVGSGPEEGRLKALVNKLKLESAVVFVGWQNDLASFYKTANIFIQTSFFEGYGMALIEAGLSGLPVITTPVGIALELEPGKDAYIYPIGNPVLFADSIIGLIENNYKRENLRMNMKSALDSKLISQGDYMAQLQRGWDETAKKIR